MNELHDKRARTQKEKNDREHLKKPCYSWDHMKSQGGHAAGLQTEQDDGVSALALFSTQEMKNNGHTMEIRCKSNI